MGPHSGSRGEELIQGYGRSTSNGAEIARDRADGTNRFSVARAEPALE